jgi:hypothetical protein
MTFLPAVFGVVCIVETAPKGADGSITRLKSLSGWGDTDPVLVQSVFFDGGVQVSESW